MEGGDGVIEEMLETAINTLSTVNEIVDGLSAPQVTVLLSNNNNIYVAVNDVDGLICEQLKFDKNTKIIKMLTMWKDGGIDLSSIKFRKALINLDEDNSNADVILRGKDGYLIKKLAVTIF